MSKARRKKATSGGLLGETLRLGGILFAICAVTALILGVVNHVTRDLIAGGEGDKLTQAMEAFAPGASFSKVENPGGDEAILEVYEITDGGAYSGLCILLDSPSYNGSITMVVGVNEAQEILGVRIISQSETEGLGSRITEEDWIAQYNGKTGPIKVVLNPPAAQDEIVAITRATQSSKSVTNGVNKALAFAQSYVK